MKLSSAVCCRDIDEAAIKPYAAFTQGNALYSTKYMHVLYDPTVVIEFFANAIEEIKQDPGVLEWDFDDTGKGYDKLNKKMSAEAGQILIDSCLEASVHAREYIIGTVLLDYVAAAGLTSSKAKRITSIAADKGYGPMMYDIAMSYSSGGLMPDRRSVSESAQRVWLRYFFDRPDVTKKPVPASLVSYSDDWLMKAALYGGVKHTKAQGLKDTIIDGNPWGNKLKKKLSKHSILDYVYTATKMAGTIKLTDTHISTEHRITNMIIDELGPAAYRAFMKSKEITTYDPTLKGVKAFLDRLSYDFFLDMYTE